MNKYKIISFALLAVVIFALAVFLIYSAEKKSELTTIKIGWQVAWATQGQIAQVLKHTDILEKNNLKGEFKGFNYGGPLNEAALAGEVDVLFTADLPAAILISKDDNWDIIARLIRFKSGIIVPKDSNINSLRDLEGKTLSAPFGSGTYVYALKLLEDKEILDKVNVRHLDILEQTSVIQSGTAEDWGEIDAFASWDPTISIFENGGKVRLLAPLNPNSFVVMSRKFIEKNPEAAREFLKAYKKAYLYYASHQEEANTLFADEARIKFDKSILDISGSYEPNLKAKTIEEIDVGIGAKDIEDLKAMIAYAYKEGVIKNIPNIEEHIIKLDG